jgi:CDP-paratose 2-epimerase
MFGKVLVTGSSGLIGSEAVVYFDKKGAKVVGVDNNMRKEFFGSGGDTSWNLKRLIQTTQNFVHYDMDIRDRKCVFELFSDNRFDLVIHCAAQPSHDKARDIPLLDFEVNALGTLNLLEATRQYCPEAAFIHMSTNKVYGDAPNEYPLVEKATRYDYARPEDYDGIDETCRIDQALHSLFGASKTAADIMAQEYGRYFNMRVGIFRAGCLTGPYHSGVEQHGFLSYLVKAAIAQKPYTIFGYKGKQVRDNLHSLDVVRAMEEFALAPRPGEVYNLGGSRQNSVSVLECVDYIEQNAGKKLAWSYCEENRIGDHICYISSVNKFKRHYPKWDITRSLDDILHEMISVEWARHK